MKLTDSVSGYFAPVVRKRGLDYYLSGRVTIGKSTPDDLIPVEVRGSRPYNVMLDVDLDEVRPYVAAYCDCPYEGAGFCKHVWAALLAVERAYKLTSVSRRCEMDYIDGEGTWPDLEEEDDFYEQFELASTAGMRVGAHSLPPPQPEWQALVSDIQVNHRYGLSDDSSRPTKLAEEIDPVYILRVGDDYRTQGRLVLSLFYQHLTATGRLSKPKKFSPKPQDMLRIRSDLDRQVCLMLVGAGEPCDRYSYYGDRRASSWAINESLCETLLPLIFKSGRVLFECHPRSEPQPITWDDGPPWELRLRIAQSGPDRGEFRGLLKREDKEVPLSEASVTFKGDPGLVIVGDKMARANWHGCYGWIGALARHGAVVFDKKDRLKLLEGLLVVEACPPMDWPAEWDVNEISNLTPVPELLLEPDRYSSRHIQASLHFHYNGVAVPANARRAVITDKKTQKYIRRQIDVESQLFRRLTELGVNRHSYSDDLRMSAKSMPEVVRTLLGEGWRIQAEKKPVRAAGDFNIEVTSGIDWFELQGDVKFGDQVMSLPEVLSAARKGQGIFKLSDGSLGMLPEDWLARYSPLLELASVDKGKLRFRRTQVMLVDALLAEMPEARFDKTLASARQSLSVLNG